jgi:hypothetical protein
MTTDEQRRPDLAAVEALLAAAELRDAEEPHTILVRDLWAGRAYATGIYPSAYAAVEDLEKVLHEATGGTGEYADQVTVEIVPLYGARGRWD